jgi:hypothetical protein
MALGLAELTDAGARELGLHARSDLVRAIRSGIGDMVCPSGKWRVRILEMPLPLMDAAAAADVLVDADALRDAVEHGDLKPQKRFDAHLRFLPSDIAAWAKGLKGSPLTKELDAELQPSLVEEYIADASDAYVMPNPMVGLDHALARGEAAAKALRAEFAASLPPTQNAVTTNANGDDELDAAKLRSQQEIDLLWQAFVARKAAKAENERYERLHRGL